MDQHGSLSLHCPHFQVWEADLRTLGCRAWFHEQGNRRREPDANSLRMRSTVASGSRSSLFHLSLTASRSSLFYLSLKEEVPARLGLHRGSANSANQQPLCLCCNALNRRF